MSILRSTTTMSNSAWPELGALPYGARLNKPGSLQISQIKALSLAHNLFPPQDVMVVLGKSMGLVADGLAEAQAVVLA